MIIKYSTFKHKFRDFSTKTGFEIQIDTKKRTFTYLRLNRTRIYPTYQGYEWKGYECDTKKIPKIALDLPKEVCKEIDNCVCTFALAFQILQPDDIFYTLDLLEFDELCITSTVEISSHKTNEKIFYPESNKPENNQNIEMVEMLVEEIGKILKKEKITLKPQKLIIRR